MKLGHVAHLAQGHTAHGERGHILHQQGVDANARKVGNELLGGLQLTLKDDGVDRNKHLGAKLMGVIGEALDVGKRIACGGTRAKLLGADIYGVGAMIDGGKATLEVLGGRQ